MGRRYLYGVVATSLGKKRPKKRSPEKRTYEAKTNKSKDRIHHLPRNPSLLLFWASTTTKQTKVVEVTIQSSPLAIERMKYLTGDLARHTMPVSGNVKDFLESTKSDNQSQNQKSALNLLLLRHHCSNFCTEIRTRFVRIVSGTKSAVENRAVNNGGCTIRRQSVHLVAQV